MMQKVPYDAQKDFVPVSIFGTGNYILATKPSLPVQSLAEFIAYAKERPGKLNYASVGPANSSISASPSLPSAQRSTSSISRTTARWRCPR